jgi:uncharacterized protein
VIENTFIHIQGIGPKTEKNIWRQGIYEWQSFLSRNGTIVSPQKDPLIRMELEETIANQNNLKYFSERLPSTETWRMYDKFKHKAAYLDIETSGEFSGGDLITVIGLYDGEKVYTFVNGRNLQEFEIAVSSYDMLITFSGSSFDLPVIKKYFPQITLPAGHIDLKFLLNRLGYRGGLKKIEKDIGIRRDADIDGLNGFDAVKLWNTYRWGDRTALDILIRYNTADIVNLKPLMEDGYNMMKKKLLCFDE